MAFKLQALLALALVAVALAAPQEKPKTQEEERIINGSPAAHQQFPFIVSLQLTVAGQPQPIKFCGGSIVNANWIVTAAHCFAQAMPGQVHVVAGTVDAFAHSNGQRVAVAQVVSHPSYNTQTHVNDIALLRLAQPLQLNAAVQPIELSPPSHVSESYGTGRVLGWGATHPVEHQYSSRHLLWTDISVISQAECRKQFPVGAGQVCVQNKGYLSGPCVGDSGGPFIQYVAGKPVLAGLTSYAVQVCSVTPTVYTRVSAYYNWVKAITG